MCFLFENGCELTEALVTALKYDNVKAMYELTVLGLDDDGFSYTQPGKAWFDDEDFDDIMADGELEFPHEIVGRKLKLVANGIERQGNHYEEKQ